MAFACYCLQRAEFLYALDALVDCEIILGKSAMNTLCCHINSLGVISDMPLSRTSFCHLLSCCPPPCLQSREIKAFFVTPEIPLISQHVLRPSTDDVCDPSGLLHQKKIDRCYLLTSKIALTSVIIENCLFCAEYRSNTKRPDHFRSRDSSEDIFQCESNMLGWLGSCHLRLSRKSALVFFGGIAQTKRKI